MKYINKLNKFNLKCHIIHCHSVLIQEHSMARIIRWTAMTRIRSSLAALFFIKMVHERCQRGYSEVMNMMFIVSRQINMLN